jgi:hypothetical protein
MLNRSNRAEDQLYANVEDFLIKKGVLWTPQPFDKVWLWKFDPIPKHCFYNAYRLAKKSGGRLRYVEGYAMGNIVPVHHAWNVDENDNVVDATWGTFTTIGRIYHGVTAPLEYVKLSHSKHNLSFLYDYKNNFPILRDAFTFIQKIKHA